MAKRKICVVTGGRSEYDVLYGLMKTLVDSREIDFDLVVTGEHLSAGGSDNVEEAIHRDGLRISRKVEMLLTTDSPSGVNKSIGLGIIGMTDAFVSLAPDIVVVSGDRFEMFAATVAASGLSIPIAHLFGGETTEGAIDEVYRHSMTKMAQLHFVATKRYRNRVIQLGEHPERVFNFGSVAIDGLYQTTLLPLKKLEQEIGFKFRETNFLVTIHPETLSTLSGIDQIRALLDALREFEGVGLIFTYPNADAGHKLIIEEIGKFVSDHPDSIFVKTLGREKYFSCINCCDGVIGNSSSGLSEVPSFKKGTVNIGDRQKGREKAASVIDCEANKDAISRAIRELLSPIFQQQLVNVNNPYGESGASLKVKEILVNYPLEDLVKKRFFDINASI